jgi:glutaredoxin|tara:strand:- start:97 stop:534 length:438 start_codon:yes stop_codon:yes gene_type:complete
MRLFKKKLNKPVVYTMKNCSYCKLTIEELEKANISFTQKDIDEHRPEWEEVMLITGLPKTPTIFFNDTYLLPMRDFRNPDQLTKILDSLKDNKKHSNMIIIETLKTLNYNIAEAFNNLNKSLQKLQENTASDHPLNSTDEHKSTN